MANYAITIESTGITGEGIFTLPTSVTVISTPLELEPGDTVTFTWSPINTSSIEITLSSFSTAWTNQSDVTLTNTNLTEVKTVASGVTVGSTWNVAVADNASPSPQGDTYYFTRPYTLPYTTIDLEDSDTTLIVNTAAVDHTISIVGNGGYPVLSGTAAQTYYRVRKGATTVSGQRLGHGSLTVDDVPSTIGNPQSYAVQALLPTADGGDSDWKATSLKSSASGGYTVTVQTASGTATNPIRDYGMAIYDPGGELVSSYTDGSTILRKVKSYNVTTQDSTGSPVTINTGVTGINNLNGLVQIRAQTVSVTDNEYEYAANIACLISSDSANAETIITVGRDLAAGGRSVTVDLLQSRGFSKNL